MIFFTSDLHLGHENVIRFENRPFRNVSEMNQILIANYNAVVQPTDTVYLLGDLSFRIPIAEANELISRLNGKKHLIRGNHDRHYAPELFEQITTYWERKEAGKWWGMMHYPILEWKRQRYGAIHVHGHIHSRGQENNLANKQAGIFRYDVGVDANNYMPVAMSSILEFYEH